MRDILTIVILFFELCLFMWFLFAFDRDLESYHNRSIAQLIVMIIWMLGFLTGGMQ